MAFRKSVDEGLLGSFPTRWDQEEPLLPGMIFFNVKLLTSVAGGAK